jgi:hypothetical protein
MRFAVSLKRSADPKGDEEWQLKHFSTVKFASDPVPDSQVSGDHGDIEMYLTDPPDDEAQIREVSVVYQDD